MNPTRGAVTPRRAIRRFPVPAFPASKKIIARETVKTLRNDMLAKCYGGDISRERNPLGKQKKGTKRMRRVGNVEIPREAFTAVLKLES